MDKKFAYLAIDKLEHKLEKELKDFEKLDKLYLSNTVPDGVVWAQNVWYEPKLIKIKSISEGAKFLRSLQKNWALYPYKAVRRSMLIQESLAKIIKTISFYTKLPKINLGSWTLLDENTLLYSQTCSSSFSNGEVCFHETLEPPSRAYLKLWEAFTIMQKIPKEREKCLEIGSSPGSWSWVLANLNVDLMSVDKAPLDNSLNKFPNINFLQKDAFAFLPEKLGRMDWIFSDLICYPEKLLAWIQKWLGFCDNFICTIKFQKDDHDGIIKEFQSIPDSKLIHLYNNKHELTWIKFKEIF
ncbi:MAG: SAM-dependent methyltransferase [Parachlamydiales bacterium]|jgi:23S rRNA (cytidine2498-2'-O)-methyltransferase